MVDHVCRSCQVDGRIERKTRDPSSPIVYIRRLNCQKINNTDPIATASMFTDFNSKHYLLFRFVYTQIGPKSKLHYCRIAVAGCFENQSVGGAIDMEATKSSLQSEKLNRETPQLVAVLKEMKEGLDTVRTKVQALTAKVKAENFRTADGISYLEAKHLLLLNYCQSLVYYLLRKAKGLSIQGHPVVQSLVEIRLFLEKIRPIDKKLQYQIQKLMKVTTNQMEKSGSTEEVADTTQKTEDLLKYRPNPDLLVSKIDNASEDGDGVYRPPKLAPAAMEEDKMSRQERNALRKERENMRQAKQSTYVRELMNDLEGRPEEITESVGPASRELTKYMEKMEERARQEEEQFTRAPLTKTEKQTMKHLKKSRNGLLGLTESFYDEIKSLPLGDNFNKELTTFDGGSSGDRKLKKRKRKH
ncbi:unnamed protein product [Fraxinus pennsylvanica]|uniref:Neuroguidin n=1 Tax=Fraxinus pennsylvanica TaxID=56036 RepID=A0AAD1Z7V1_9LAMI|nr:unnamed protein product [Fraxinus pennsylvanica]